MEVAEVHGGLLDLADQHSDVEKGTYPASSGCFLS